LHHGYVEAFDQAAEKGVVEPADQSGLAAGEGVERTVVQAYPGAIALGFETKVPEHCLHLNVPPRR
jgi:hypothetical protein